MEIQKRNTPVATLIKNYTNKKSGKVSEAKKELMTRFTYLDWEDQKTIALAFLSSSKTDRNWMYPKLLNLWDECFAQKIKELWESYIEERCSWLVVKFFPVDYIKENLDSLNCYDNSYHIAMRLGDDPSFHIKLDDYQGKVFDYLNLMNHFKRTVSAEDAERILFGAIRDIAKLNYVTDYMDDYEEDSHYYNDLETDYCYYDKVSALNFKPIYEIVDKLESVGGTNAIMKFKEWDEQAATMIQNRYLGAIRDINSHPQEFRKSTLVNLARHTYWILLTDEQLEYPRILPGKEYYMLLSTCKERDREFQQLSTQYYIPGYRKWWNDSKEPTHNPGVFTNTSEIDEETMAKWKENPQFRYLVEKLGLEVVNPGFEELCELPF